MTDLPVRADLGLLHFEPEVVPLAGPLADPGEHGVAAVDLGDAGDQLGEDHRLAQPGAAEEADLAAADERGEQVDDLDARLEHLGLGREVVERGRVAVDRPALRRVRPAPRPSIGSPSRLKTRPSVSLPTGTVTGPPVSTTVHPADQAVGRAQGHAADAVAAEVLLDLAGQVDLDPLLLGVDRQGVVDLGQVPLVELGVERRADHLGDPSGRGRGGHGRSSAKSTRGHGGHR